MVKAICWICNQNNANSGEHTIKKSDLNGLYLQVSQKEPIHKRRDGSIVKPIGSIKSSGFHYEKVICTECNNSKTQKFDRSWEVLSDYFRKNWSDIKQANRFCLSSVFPENELSEMVNVQLFFVKLFGCKLKESKAAFALSNFSRALNEAGEHSSIYLSFGVSRHGKSQSYSVNSDVQACRDSSGRIVYMHWFYVIGDLTVNLIYSEKTEEIDLNGAKKPSEMGGFCSLVRLNYDQSYLQDVQLNILGN